MYVCSYHFYLGWCTNKWCSCRNHHGQLHIYITFFHNFLMRCV